MTGTPHDGTDPDPYDLWMQARGNPDLYRRLCIAATEQDPLPDLPHEPGDGHCGVGGRPKPDHPHYRRCSCGRWYAWNGSVWRPGRPSAAWLRQHGYGDPGEFWDIGADRERDSLFGEFFVHGGWRAVLRAWLRR